MHTTDRPIVPENQDATTALAQRIAKELGLDFFDSRQTRLRSALRQARLTSADTGTLSLTTLLPHLVVGETYFRRDPETWQALQQDVLHPLLQSRIQASDRSLRVWSAACCTGEEAYTLLFCLADLLGPALADWQLTLLATDINPAFIAHAKAGWYGDYAFRQSTPAWRERYFTREGKGWRVAPPWRSHIRFAVHNLALHDYSVAGPSAQGYDLILCRNVLMYLTPMATNLALQRLQAQLAPKGLLLLAAAEAGLAQAAGFGGRMLGLGYGISHDSGANPPALRTTKATTAPLPPHRSPPRARKPQSNPQVEPTVRTVAAAPPPLATYEDYLSQAQAQADRGELGAAGASCQQAIQLAPLRLEAYWLLSLTLEAASRPEATLAVLDKLAYLAPDLAMAPYLASQLYLRLGQTEQAERQRQHCLHLLAGQDEQSLVTLGDGMSVAQLRQLCLGLGAFPS
ncbi:protein-glutamate O-methyltransferase [Chitinimonas prasina]|uniref:Protein-glutamate O-methyltransferase n=1 Tax=Chitinimonas prasina TaxID=1434937 RepID=A0ABQ5YB87_9NEIS|nr:CheR family methyltransferase [Chitinimonas prasina]GLR11677.1 protein-glutamate O-methyltransferase [Chitinimonas prasina]